MLRLRGERCDACGRRPATRVTPSQLVLIERGKKARSRRLADWFCDDCRQRNEAAHAESARQIADHDAYIWRQTPIWLGGAPVIDDLPAPLSATHRPPQDPAWNLPYVEILPFETAVGIFAEAICHTRAGELHVSHWGREMPTSYNDAVQRAWPVDEGHTASATGSVYRLPDNRVVLHWHSFDISWWG